MVRTRGDRLIPAEVTSQRKESSNHARERRPVIQKVVIKRVPRKQGRPLTSLKFRGGERETVILNGEKGQLLSTFKEEG